MVWGNGLKIQESCGKVFFFEKCRKGRKFILDPNRHQRQFGQLEPDFVIFFAEFRLSLRFIVSPP